MGSWYWRLRVGVVDNFEVLVVAALLIGAVGGFLTYTTAGSDATETVTRETASWQSTGEFTHRATVVDGTAAFESGTVLRNRSVYFLRVTPILDGAFVYGYQASDSGDLDVTTTITLRYQSVSASDEGSQTVYWRVERQLRRSSASLAPGERARTPFSVNVSAAAAEAQRIDEELGGTPGDVQVVVVARTAISGTRNGRSVETTRVNQTRIVTSGGTYSVRNDGPWPASGGQETDVTVPADSDPLRSAGGPALLVAGLGGLAGLGLFRRSDNFTVTDAERELSAYESEREEFDEWITTGRLPESTFAQTRIEVDSLAGLVDVAIDSERRVIQDTDRDVFAVLTDGYRYMYYPPKGPALTGDADGTAPAEADDPTDADADGDSTDPADGESEATDEPPADAPEDPTEDKWGELFDEVPAAESDVSAAESDEAESDAGTDGESPGHAGGPSDPDES